MKTEERIKRILGPSEDLEARFVGSLEELKEIVSRLRGVGNKICFTSGVWDLKHIGHEAYLTKAREHGDILIVGCDVDELTKKKGPNRPFVPMEERSAQLANLRSVSIVIPVHSYEEADIIVKSIRPDVYVISESTEKNREDHVKRIRELHENNCGELLVLPPQATTSTTALARNLILGGVDKFYQGLRSTIDRYCEDFKNGEK